MDLSIWYDINLISVICLIAGFLLVIYEMIHPGFGAPGILGGVLLLIFIGIVAKTMMAAMVLLIILFFIVFIMVYFAFKSATKGKLSKVLILRQTQQKEAGYVGTENLDSFLNEVGIAETILRPAGKADFNGKKLDVVTEGEFISQNKKVKIIQIQGRKIVVKEII